jgi:hypothetical protein
VVSAAAPPLRFAGSEGQLYDAARTLARADDHRAIDAEGLRVLLRALDHAPAPIVPAGRELIWGVLTGVVASRIFAFRGWDAHPECLDRPLAAPLVITGLPRSGTTALHKLLSFDPQFQGLEYWLTDFPMPRPPRETWADNPFFRHAAGVLTAKQDADPSMRAKHFEKAEEVDECLHTLKSSFVANYFGEFCHVPDYDAWWRAQDEAATALPWYRDVMRLIGAHDDRPWLLKNPGHMWCLEGLFSVYPDARVVHIHRDPVRALPSLCSLVSGSRKVIEAGRVDLHDLGRRDLAVWGEHMRRMLAYRARRPEPFFDVWHDDFNADPLGVVRAIYERFGLVLSPAAEAAMAARLADNPDRAHGEHHYSLDQFGLTADAVRETFGAYVSFAGFDRRPAAGGGAR